MRTMWRAAMVALIAGIGVLAFATEADDPEKVVLKDEDNGETVELRIGQALEIRLKTYAGVPYKWEAIEAEPAVVEQQGDSVFEQDKTEMTEGQSGCEVFTFKAVKAGTAELKLVCRSLSREKDAPPEKTFTVEVTVK